MDDGRTPTEGRNPRTGDLDDLSSLDVLRRLHHEDLIAVEAVGAVLPDLARVVDLAAERFRRGGTVHYFGAGTSGRLAMLDASELLPTFSLEPGRIVGHIAGGSRALVGPVEDAEDDDAEGRRLGAELGPDDLAVGLAASGRTPFVRGGLEGARESGAATVLVSSNPHAPLAATADVHLVLETGPEAVTGSTRLKAGTAQKLVLNGFSTALMVAVGRTWGNRMVSLVATNAKLRDRTVRILQEACGLDREDAASCLARADGDLKVALVAELAGVGPDRAEAVLRETDGTVRRALARLSGDQA